MVVVSTISSLSKAVWAIQTFNTMEDFSMFRLEKYLVLAGMIPQYIQYVSKPILEYKDLFTNLSLEHVTLAHPTT